MRLTPMLHNSFTPNIPVFWHYFLDVVGLLIVVGVLGAIAYDIVATLTGFTTISALIQAWGSVHKFWLLIFTGLLLGLMGALAVHFLWP